MVYNATLLILSRGAKMKTRFFRITILLIALCLFLSTGSFVYADVTESTPEIGGVTEAVDGLGPGSGKEAGSKEGTCKKGSA